MVAKFSANPVFSEGRRRAGKSALAFGLFLLAGCTGASQALPEASSEIRAPAPEVSSQKGAIEGLVVDTSLLPVEGADVGLFPIADAQQPSATFATGPDGRFVFSLLDPGPYRIHATKAGYGGGAVFVQVAADEAVSATLRLDEVASNEPYVEIFPWTGILRCGFAVVVYSDNCGISDEVQGETRLQHQYNISAGYRTILIETTWPYTDTTMDNWLRWREPETEPWFFLGGAIGEPVLRNVILPGHKAQATAIATLVPKDLPDFETPIELLVQTFYDGKLQREANETVAYEACKHVLGYCAGAGLALEFRFDQYVSIFVHAPPPSVELYSAIPDA